MNTNEISLKTNSHLKWIQNVSDILKLFFLVAAGVYAFYALVLVVDVKQYVHLPFDRKLEAICDALRQIARFILMCFCYRFFSSSSRGEFLTSKVAHSIRLIGYAYFLIALTVFPEALLAMKDDSKMIVPHFISSLFVSFLFLFIAWILNVSLKIKEEREPTV